VIRKRFILFVLFAILAPRVMEAQPVVSYFIPDIGTPGMNTYLEIIAPHDSIADFGADGFYYGNRGDILQIVCANPSDTQYVRFGPCIVSWNGRMIATQVYVLPWVQATSTDWQQSIKIPIQVLLDGLLSNADTFYIVKPQDLDPGSTLTSPGVIGSGGPWGTRSRRGAMIVDSLTLLGSGSYTFSTTDCDLDARGNQGFLPFILISKGKINVGGSTTLDVSGNGIEAGPGGGGGGNGLVCGSQGGDGFTGGGGNADWYSGCAAEPAGTGTGTAQNGLNGVIGGESSFQNEGGGGGTGHPFGAGGDAGFFPSGNSNPPGSYGGGKGGPGCCTAEEGGGGGGGFTIRGFDGGIIPLHTSGGNLYGNTELVPYSGGSGGGGGNVNTDDQLGVGAGSGGGGGGAFILYGKSALINGTLKSAGGNGENSYNNNGAGGGGSGGAVVCGAKVSLSITKADVSLGGGGVGTPFGASGQDGGSGSIGRVRFDGPLPATAISVTSRASKYNGPSTDASDTVTRTFILTGSGNANEIQIHVRPLHGQWSLAQSITNYSRFGNKWKATITLPGNDSVYLLAAAQGVLNPSKATYTTEPSWILSQAAANILYVLCPQNSIAASDTAINFGTVSLCADVFDTIIISNDGCNDATQTSSIADITTGVSVSNSGNPALPVQTKDTIVVHLHPNKAGLSSTILTIHTTTGDIMIPVAWSGDKSAPSMSIVPASADLGNISRCSDGFDTIYLQNLGCDSLTLADNLSDTSIGLEIFRRSKSSLATNTRDTIILHFQPKNLGPFTTTLHLKYGDRDTIISVNANVTPGAQVLQFAPSKIDFGKLARCITVFDTIFIQSSGCDTLRLQAGIDDATSGVLLMRGPKPLLPQGALDTLIVSFRPRRAGLIGANILLSYQGNDTIIPISAFGVNDSTPLVIAVSPLIQSFECGTKSFSLTLTNPTCDSLTLLSYSLGGNDTSDFPISSLTPLGISAGTSANVIGTFNPQDSGARNAAITFHFIRTDGTTIDTTVSLFGIGILQHIRLALPASLPSVQREQKVSIPIISLDSSQVPVSIFDFALRFNTDLLEPSIDPVAGLFAGASVDRFNVSRDSISVRLRLASPKQITPGVLCSINCLTYITDTLSTVVELQRTGFGSLSSAIECLATTNGDSVLFNLDPQCGDPSISGFLAGRFPNLNSIIPNPGKGIEKISYELPISSTVKIEVFNQLGEKLRTLLTASEEAGKHGHQFDISDLPSGSYYFRIAIGQKSQMRPFELLK